MGTKKSRVDLNRNQPGFSQLVRRCPTLPLPVGGSTIGAGRLNFRVRDGSGCFPSAVAAGTLIELFHVGSPAAPLCGGGWCVVSVLYSGCACLLVVVLSDRPVSTSQLNTLLCLHFWPINPVV
jgi:hypothetical protein